MQIFRDGTLIDVHVSFWSGGKALTAEDLGLQESDVAEAFKLGKKMLISEEVIRKFRAVEAKARGTVDKNSFVFPIGHARFIPKRKVDKVITELQACKGEYANLVRDLVDNYDKYRTDMIPVYEEAAATAYIKSQPATKVFSIETEDVERAEFIRKFFDRINTFYPTKESLSARFDLCWEVYEIATPTFDKAEMAQAEYKKQMESKMGSFVSDVVTSLRAQTIEMCTKITEMIKTGKVIRSNTIDNLRGFIDEFKDLNFVGDTAVEEQLTALKASLNVESKTLNESADLKDELSRKLTGIVAAASEITDISSITGQYKRKISWE